MCNDCSTSQGPFQIKDKCRIRCKPGYELKRKSGTDEKYASIRCSDKGDWVLASEKHEFICFNPWSRSELENDLEVVNHPIIENTLYVDPINGNDNYKGKSPNWAVKTLTKVISLASDGTQIFLRSGVYYNKNFGHGLNNDAILSIRNMENIWITAYGNEKPVLKFDGAGGIALSQVQNFKISNITIEGPNYEIERSEAEADRLLHSKKYSGRGIAVWSGSHQQFANFFSRYSNVFNLRLFRTFFQIF